LALPKPDPLKPQPGRREPGARSVRGPKLAEDLTVTPAAHTLDGHTGSLTKSRLNSTTLVEEGNGVPVHTAERSTQYHDLDTNKVYINSDGATTWVEIGTGAGSGYATIQDEGSALTQRTTVDFVGAGVTATDTGAKTQVNIPGGGGEDIEATLILGTDANGQILQNLAALDFTDGGLLTINASDEITVTNAVHSVQGAAGAADTLKYILGGNTEQVLFLRIPAGVGNVTVQHSATSASGNIVTADGVNLVLTSPSANAPYSWLVAIKIDNLYPGSIDGWMVMSMRPSHDLLGTAHTDSLRPTDGGGLDVAYEAGDVFIGGSKYSVVAGTITLPNNEALVYVFVNSGGAVASNTTGFPADSIPIAICTTSAGDITLFVDGRALYTIGVTAHGIAAHTGHANWKVLYTDGSGDEQELSLGAAPSASLGHTYLRSEGVAAAPVMAQEMKSISLTVEDPTSAEDISIVFFFQAVTVRELQCVVVGSATPSVTINPKHGTDRSAAGTALLNAATAITNTTTGQNLTSFTDNTLVADSFLWLETTAKSGTVDELHITIRYTAD